MTLDEKITKLKEKYQQTLKLVNQMQGQEKSDGKKELLRINTRIDECFYAKRMLDVGKKPEYRLLYQHKKQLPT